MQEIAPRFSKFSRGRGHAPDPLSNSLAALGRAPWIITLQSIFETWQAWDSIICMFNMLYEHVDDGLVLL